MVEEWGNRGFGGHREMRGMREIKTPSEMIIQKTKQSKEKLFAEAEEVGKGDELEVQWQIMQTDRRSFQPSTHQRAQLFRCLVGNKGRQTDCSQ